MDRNNYCIYCHTNTINGKKYIGQTKYGENPQQRWRYGSGYQNCEVFNKAIQKYGWDNFEHHILLDGLTQDEANYFEEFYIKLYHTCIIDKDCWGYNSTYGGDNSLVSDLTREKLRQSSLKLWNNEEYRKKVTYGRKGRKHSQKTKQLISNILSGRTLSEEHKQNLRKQKLGISFSEEHKKHLSEKSAHSKKVRCIETGEVFNSCSEAAKAMNMSKNSRTHISRVCKSIEQTAGIHPITQEKLHWEYVIEKEDLYNE